VQTHTLGPAGFRCLLVERLRVFDLKPPSLVVNGVLLLWTRITATPLAPPNCLIDRFALSGDLELSFELSDDFSKSRTGVF